MSERSVEFQLRRYDSVPHLVFWETTKACGLACRHCRALAQWGPAPGELSTEEGVRFLDDLATMPSPPIVVLTGGDCLRRRDLEELIDYGRDRGIRFALSPSVTDELTAERLAGLYERGIRAVSISLDGDNATTHDGIRGVPGHFATTLEALDTLSSLGFRVQVNTTVMSKNVHEIARIATLLEEHDIRTWEVFFLIGVGRGAELDEVAPAVGEDVCHLLVDMTERGLTVRTVEAPFFRRVQAERASGRVTSDTRATESATYRGWRDELAAVSPPVRPATRSHSLATGDGRGIIFVGHDGEVYASGFLPVSLGNVREHSLVEIYQDHPDLQRLRHGELEGECGRCDYRQLCGGSRARAVARFGRLGAEDPACVRTEVARRGRATRLPLATA